MIGDSPKQMEFRRLPTVFAGLFLAFAWALNVVVLAWVHDYVPRDLHPLPDSFFRIFPEVPWVMRIAEYLMLIITISGFAVMFFHQHRWIVIRRTFFIAAICYTFRAFCIVPVPSNNTYCAPQVNSSLEVMFNRVIPMFWSAGIEQIRPRELCGDLIVSGHTLTIFIAMMVFRHYAPRKLTYLGYLYHIFAFIAIICILFARKHYTIDVVFGYLAATRTFWTYHALLQSFHDGTLDRNPLTQTCWAWAVPLLERDAPPPQLFLNVLEWPSSCPQKIRRRFSF
ncbi:Sphingomyelin synthase-related 2 [Aphelenchoides besseyi]|nr:Sphingomyelin synthase-related 2 [Aphelenchoides besseyi]KAI6194932.1 Sphingomyelin synthase-related 2 [Aphelenchoides besseyi]